MLGQGNAIHELTRNDTKQALVRVISFEFVDRLSAVLKKRKRDR
jgi:hypothetical protein